MHSEDIPSTPNKDVYQKTPLLTQCSEVHHAAGMDLSEGSIFGPSPSSTSGFRETEPMDTSGGTGGGGEQQQSGERSVGPSTSSFSHLIEPAAALATAVASSEPFTTSTTSSNDTHVVVAQESGYAIDIGIEQKKSSVYHHHGESSSSIVNQGNFSSSSSSSEVFIMHDEEDEELYTTPPVKILKDRVSQYEAQQAKSAATWAALYKGKGKDLDGAVQFIVKKTKWVPGANPTGKIPNELWGLIFTYLDVRSLHQLSLVSRRFYTMITDPHTWMNIFLKRFPCQVLDKKGVGKKAANIGTTKMKAHDLEIRALHSNNKRYFTRLSASPTWQQEFLYRTSLLRSLFQGRAFSPQYSQAPLTNAGNRNGVVSKNAGSMISYYAGSNTGVTQISATFPPIQRSMKNSKIGVSSLRPHLLHCSYDIYSIITSDPTTGRMDTIPSWAPPRPHFEWAETDVQFHMPGALLGPCVKALSEEIGWVAGETVPGGRAYVELKMLCVPGSNIRGRFMEHSNEVIQEERLSYVSAVWIVKSRVGSGLFDTTKGKCGVIVARSTGRISMYRLPTYNKLLDTTWVKPIKTWMVCPGVPIIDIKVDDDFSVKRQSRYRRNNEGIVAVLANALGEVYYLRNFDGPWRMIPQTTRMVSPDCYWPETRFKELEENPKAMLDLAWTELEYGWANWGMDYFIEVDFADGNVVVGRQRFQHHLLGTRVGTGNAQGAAWVNVYHLQNDPSTGNKTEESEEFEGYVYKPYQPPTGKNNKKGNVPSIFDPEPDPEPEVFMETEPETVTEVPLNGALEDQPKDKWVMESLSFAGEELSQNSFHISAHTLDYSNPALLAADEVPYLKRPGGLVQPQMVEIPGRNARLFAVGTTSGSVFVWNIRLFSNDYATTKPMRIIHTESLVVTAVGLTSLYLIHGGSDGMVQCWDPLCSSEKPLRTIHGRVTPLDPNIIDAMMCARAFALDPDPTVLRGALGVGTGIRYWSFAGDVSSQINGRRRKKMVRKAGVGGGGIPGKVNHKGDLIGDIGTEAYLWKKEMEEARRKEQKLLDRFGLHEGEGTDCLNEEEMLEYARMLSEEAYQADIASKTAVWNQTSMKDGLVKDSASWSSVQGVSSAASSSRRSSVNYEDYTSEDGDGTVDFDLAEATRLSLLETCPGEAVSHRYVYGDKTPDFIVEPVAGSSRLATTSTTFTTASTSTTLPFHAPPPGYYDGPVGAAGSSTFPAGASGKSASTVAAGLGKQENMYIEEWPSPRRAALAPDDKFADGLSLEDVDPDLAFAIKISLAEEESRRLAEEEEARRVGLGEGEKGKGVSLA